MRRGVLIVSAAILIAAAGCGPSETTRVEEAVRVAADARLAEIDSDAPGLRVTAVSCQRTTAIQDDVDQYYCDIRVANEAGAGFVDRDSEVFYSTSDGTADLLTFPPSSTR